MVNVNGKEVNSVQEILQAFRASPRDWPVTYRVRYSYGTQDGRDWYSGARLERPRPLRMNGDGVYPWEAVLVAAANCAGSDYPVLAEHWGVDLENVDVELEAVFDPRGEFEGLGEMPGHAAGAKDCYHALRWKATIRSSSPREAVQRVHDRALSHNMVLNALRGVPLSSELVVKAPLRKVM